MWQQISVDLEGQIYRGEYRFEQGWVQARYLGSVGPQIHIGGLSPKFLGETLLLQLIMPPAGVSTPSSNYAV